MVKTSPFHGGITGSNPVGVITLWRITQVRLKGTVLKTVRCVKARKGSNPLSSLLIYYRGVEQLVARRAHNPEVVGSNPSPAIPVWPCSVAVNTPPCHGGDRRFKSGQGRSIGAVAQLVEQRIEAPCVGSSTLSCAIAIHGGIAKWPNAADCKSVPSGS